MITHCQECDTYFRVSVDQLKAANGQVKCGCCMTVFNAIDSLLENQDAPAQAALVPDESNPTSSAAETDDVIPTEINRDDPTESDVLDLDDPVPVEDAFDQDTDQPDGDRADDEQTPSDTTTFEIEPLDLDLIEQTIEQDQPGKTATFSPFWAATAALLLLLIGFQYARYDAEALVTQFPALSPLCPWLDCPVTETPHEAQAIQLVSRDVREHPQFENILLVNAILMNADQTQQAFPALQLDLFDNIGRPVGSRIFSPQEYLDSSVDIDRGMQPELPVHIVLEVVGNGEQTSSFEFNFL